MTNEPRPAEPQGHFHAVQFYSDRKSLASLVGQFIAEGFSDGLPAIVIATPEHRALIEADLEERGQNVARLMETGDLFMFDAEATLAEFMKDGMPDAGRFRRTLVPIIEEACKGRTECVIRAYGEMVDVLWQQGHTSAATRLEMLWNDLAQSKKFSLLCGYSMGSFYKDAAKQEIADLHSHLVPLDAVSVPVL